MTEATLQARLTNDFGDPSLAEAVEEIETALRAHEAVRQARVIPVVSASGAPEMICYVVPDDARLPLTFAPAPELQIDRWRKLFDLMHTRPSGPSGSKVPLGERPRPRWTSRHTRQPFPDHEIEEWIGATLRLVLDLDPSRVLEIGVGSGVLCARLAPHCASYLGTDFSARSLAELAEYLAAASPPLGHVRLMERPANDFSGLDDDAFDTVIVNSVVQYFPNASYLDEMLAGALRVTRPGGTILLGDVRSLPLVEAYCTSLELSRAPGELPLQALAARVRRQLALQDELLISPAHFARSAHPEIAHKIAHVETRPKRGAHDNELSIYRFETLIHVGPQPERCVAPAWIDWEPSLTDQALAEMLATPGAPRLALRGIANARLERQVAAWTRLRADDGGDVQSLKAELAARPLQGLSPERVCALGEAAGLRVRLSFASSAPDGRFDAVFERVDLPARPIAWQWPARLGRTSNDPALSARRQGLVPLLLAHCEQRLRSDRRPSSIIMIDGASEGPST